MDNNYIKNLDKQFNEYKKKIVNMVDKQCNNIQPYIDSYTDSFSGWKIESTSNQREDSNTCNNQKK